MDENNDHALLSKLYKNNDSLPKKLVLEDFNTDHREKSCLTELVSQLNSGKLSVIDCKN